MARTHLEEAGKQDLPPSYEPKLAYRLGKTLFMLQVEPERRGCRRGNYTDLGAGVEKKLLLAYRGGAIDNSHAVLNGDGTSCDVASRGGVIVRTEKSQRDLHGASG